MQQIEPENSEKIELENRDKPNSMETFGNFWSSGFRCKEENRHFLNLNVSSKMNLFDLDRDGRNHASTNGETFFWKSRWFKTKYLQCVFALQYFYTGIKLNFSQSNPALQL